MGPPGGASSFSHNSGQRGQDPASYREELQRQVAETKARKDAEKRKREADDERALKEAEIYDPFGKGGAGAPIKTASGNVVADLRKLHAINEEFLDDPTSGRKSYEPLDSGPKKNMTYKDYLEEQIKIKEKKKAVERAKIEAEELKDAERMRQQQLRI